MRSRLLSSASALALVASGVVLALAPASPASAHCDGHGTHPDLYSGGNIGWRDGSYIKAYPHIDCISVGQGFIGDGIDVHCRTYTANYWYHVRNDRTGVAGWVREDALRLDGNPYVPFC